MSHLISYGTVTLDRALDFLASRTCSPSTFGAQLDAMRESAAHAQRVDEEDEEPGDTAQLVRVGPIRKDPFAAQTNAENRILQEIGTIRCLDALAGLRHDRVMKNKAGLARLQKLVPDATSGALVILCLRAFAEWHLQSKERALAAVYTWASSLAPDAYPIPKHRESDLAQAFRAGKAVRARARAAELYGDCYLVLADWITAWNRRQIRAVA
ncbi:MAG: hypothetical protein KF795_00210 [Labilithrix sp.]|nr:hypothetical protein [Labilithrix sp.]